MGFLKQIQTVAKEEEDMKKLYIIIIGLLFSIISCKAQLNNLSNTELFDGITFNNVSLGDIMKTKGNLAKMKTFFGNNIIEEANETAPFLAKDLHNNDFSFGFEDETDTGNDYSLTSIYILNSTVKVTVKDLSIKIGDDKSKFASFIFNTFNGDNSYNFTDKDTGSVGLHFKIGNNNKVSKIELICF